MQSCLFFARCDVQVQRQLCVGVRAFTHTPHFLLLKHKVHRRGNILAVCGKHHERHWHVFHHILKPSVHCIETLYF